MSFCDFQDLKYTTKNNKILHTKTTRKGNLSGGRLNKKDGLTRYGNSHVKDKTSYLSLTWKSPYVDKTVFILRRGPESV